MALQSGVQVSQELINVLIDATSNIRCVKSMIDNNAFVVSITLLKNECHLTDFDLVYNSSRDDEPAYFFYRLALDSEWLLIQFIPETAIIRLKMLYASSKSTLLKELNIKFQDHYFVTHKNELTQQCYLNHRKHCESENPLTNREIEIKRIRNEESYLSLETAKKSLMTTLSFTPSQACIISLQEFKEKSFNFVSICVGLNETFELDSKSNLSTNNPSNIPTNDPKFILYAFKEITVFCYVCPPKAPIKRKMMFSSSKSGLIEYIEERSKIHIDHKFEVDDFKELNEELNRLSDSVHSTVRFSKPLRPGRI